MAEVIGSYRILERIRIAHREAFVAQKDGAEPVVVCCYPWPREREELEADLARAQEIEHPAALRLLEHFEHDGRLALVFERFECLSLAKILGHLAEHAEDLACGAVVYIGAEVAAALVEGQRGFRPGKINRRLVHGEVGPERVLVGWDGTVKLAGLGLRLLAAEERADGKPTERPVRGRPSDDAYALAATLWTALLREAPDPAKPLPKLEERRPEIDRQLRFALERALTADGRPYSIQTLANLLQRGVSEADKNELVWNMDVLRWIVGGGVSEEVAALPANSEAGHDEAPARDPLDSGERQTPVSTRSTTRWRFPRERAPEPDESGAHITARWQRASLLNRGGPRLLPAETRRARAQRWLGAIVVSSLLAFGFGVAATLALDDGDRPPSAAETSAAEKSTAEPADAPADPSSATATALESAAPDPQPSAPPDPEPGADPLSDEGADALPPGEGFLVVRSPRHAGVYVGGKLLGTTGERLRAPCGTHFVRVGSVPLKRWYGSGQAVRIQCRSLTSVAIADKRKR